MSRRAHSGRSTTALGHAARSLCEPLERRMLLAITWGNRGSAGSDSDGFNALFGGNASIARQNVDRAILDWNRVILNFNYGGGQPNSFNLNFTSAAIASIASCSVTGQVGGKPTEATIRIQNNAGTHWVDPTPLDDDEFTDVRNAFTGLAPGVAATDLYATALHEIGHAVGISSNTSLLMNNFVTDSGVDDPNTGAAGNLLRLNIGGGPIEATVTGSDPGHLWEGPGNANTNAAGLPWNQDILMNPGRAITPNERNLISDFEANLLAQIYGYTIQLPSVINNMFVRANFNTDVVTINGQLGNVNDLIIVQQGPTDFLQVIITTVGGGATFTENVPLSLVGNIFVNGNEGDDILRLEYNAGRTTRLDGGNGNDFFDFSFGAKILANITGPTTVAGGNGVDRVFTYDNNSVIDHTFSITQSRFDRPGWGGFFYPADIESLAVTTGTVANIVNVFNTYPNQPVVINSSGGADTVNIGDASGVQGIRGDVQIQNDPNYTVININNTGDTVGRNIAIDQWAGNFGAIGGLAPAYITWDRNDVQTVNISTGQGQDSIGLLRTSEAINFFNPLGRDSLTIGNNVDGMQSITGNVTVLPDPGLRFTDIILNDTADTVGRSTVWTRVPGGYQISGLAPATITYDYQSVIYVNVLGGSGGDAYTFVGIDDDWAQTVIDGGGGVNALLVDDVASPFNANVADIMPGSIHRGINLAVGAVDVFFSNIQAPTFYAKNTTTTINVWGVSNAIPAGQQLTVISGAGSDTLNLYPHDSQGNLTVNGNFGFGGGNGTDTVLIYDDYAFGAPINYSFYNAFGPGTTNVGGLGAAGFGAGSDVENIIVSAGAGADNFHISSFESGSALAINAGSGNDVLNFGISTLATITNMASFLFNGQNGTDTFNVNNYGQNVGFTYTSSTTLIGASGTNGANYAMNESSTEVVRFNAGPQSDSLYVYTVAPGASVEFNASAGIDGLVLGGGNNNVDGIRGSIVYNAQSEGGNMLLSDTADTTGDIVHVDANTIGAYAGDTFFGPGGSLRFTDLTNFGAFPGITLNLGSGADTIYAQPLATARVTINAANPATAPGDALNLALAAAQNPAITATSNGNVTASNRQTLNWTGVEGPFATDAVAPTVVQGTINVNGVPVGARAPFRRQAVDVQFSENVSAMLSPASLLLTNQTTGQAVPTSFIALQYESATNIAHFTFPGYANGVLPDGNYQGRVFAGLPDSFGNALPADAQFSFFVLGGDADHDRDVDVNDLGILASNWQQTGRTFSQGDFDFSGTVDVNDLGILASRWQQNLAAGAALSPSGPRDPSVFSGHKRAARLIEGLI